LAFLDPLTSTVNINLKEPVSPAFGKGFSSVPFRNGEIIPIMDPSGKAFEEPGIIVGNFRKNETLSAKENDNNQFTSAISLNREWNDPLAALDPFRNESGEPSVKSLPTTTGGELISKGGAIDFSSGIGKQGENFSPTSSTYSQPLVTGNYSSQAAIDNWVTMQQGITSPQDLPGADQGQAGPSDPSDNHILERLTIPTNTRIGVNSHTVLTAGVTYALLARGDFQYGSLTTHRADAQ
jgi:hypothetical protein